MPTTSIGGNLEIVASHLPDGTIASEAKQDVGNTALASMDAKAPALVGGRVPVVLPAGAGGLTDEELRATPVAVSGTFFPQTQPVSGSVSVSNHPASVAISNLPATQPVSIATMPTTPVSGTFWQATQPVSLTSVPSHAVTGPATNAELRATPLPVSGTVAISGSVSTTSGAPALTVRASGNVAAPGASAVICDSGALAAGSYAVHFDLASLDTLAVGKGLIVEHRNAANNATTHTLGGCVAGESRNGVVQRVTVASNERIRVIAGTAAGAASSRYVAHISLYPVT